MERVRKHVGRTAVSPITQGLIKTTSSGLIASCAGILIVWAFDKQSISDLQSSIGLCSAATAIPILIVSKLMTDIIDRYECLPTKVADFVDAAFLLGATLAIFSYLMLTGGVVAKCLAISTALTGLIMFRFTWLLKNERPGDGQ